jgi:hypothetical protein
MSTPSIEPRTAPPAADPRAEVVARWAMFEAQGWEPEHFLHYFNVGRQTSFRLEDLVEDERP